VKTWFSARRCVALLSGAAFGVCLAFGSSAARADIIPSLTSITPVSGGFNWTYTVTLSGPRTSSRRSEFLGSEHSMISVRFRSSAALGC
jgi:hypothetical protein